MAVLPAELGQYWHMALIGAILALIFLDFLVRFLVPAVVVMIESPTPLSASQRMTLQEAGRPLVQALAERVVTVDDKEGSRP